MKNKAQNVFFNLLLVTVVFFSVLPAFAHDRVYNECEAVVVSKEVHEYTKRYDLVNGYGMVIAQNIPFPEQCYHVTVQDSTGTHTFCVSKRVYKKLQKNQSCCEGFNYAYVVTQEKHILKRKAQGFVNS
jgi:hypothetical protein